MIAFLRESADSAEFAPVRRFLWFVEKSGFPSVIVGLARRRVKKSWSTRRAARECAEDSAAEMPRYRRVAAQIAKQSSARAATQRSGRKEPRPSGTIKQAAHPEKDAPIGIAICL